MLCCQLHLCGDQFDEGEDSSDISSRGSQLQALSQEALSGGMGPEMQPAPDEHQVPAGDSDRQVRHLVKLYVNLARLF